VRLCVGHTCELCKDAHTDQHAVLGVDQSWTSVGYIRGLGWFWKVWLFCVLGWVEIRLMMTFLAQLMAWTVTFLLSYCPSLPATNYWSTESRIIVSLNGIWIVYDVFAINIYVWFVVPIIILFSIAKCRWWVGLGQVIISVGSVGLGFIKRCGLAWAQATWPHLVRARL